ncbi:DUF5752 family protein [Desulfonatronovibrio magnus]|uniref:DUF5752 family protein n=1 Tax=Desulfonatronovibrio magnus TaxID=698827 RepID=UPI0005EAD9A4|nr:DUF5752 family protein [Desulfonatronovibrio magnus]
MSPNNSTTDQTFSLKDCALIAIATGRRAFTLTELRNHIRDVGIDCIYHHFWGGLLGVSFEESEFNNDFAIWCRKHLHEPALGEQLSVIDPVEHKNLEDLRLEVLDVIDSRLDESDASLFLRAARPFDFLRSLLVIFDTGKKLIRPEDLPSVLPELTTGSIFYHFIDARCRLDGGLDDFRFWLSGFGEEYSTLCKKLSGIDPFFSSLSQVQEELTYVCKQHLNREEI